MTLALAVVPCAPVFGGVGDEEQAATALVEVPGTAQVRGGAAGVGDFARQGGLKDHPQLDGVLAVADGGRHQLADHEFGGEGQFFQPSDGQLIGCLDAGRGDDCRVAGETQVAT